MSSAEGPFRAGLAASDGAGEERGVLALDQCLVELKQRGRAQQGGNFLDATPVHKQRGEPEHEAIEGGQIRRPMPGTIANEQLVLQ